MSHLNYEQLDDDVITGSIYHSMGAIERKGAWLRFRCSAHLCIP